MSFLKKNVGAIYAKSLSLVIGLLAFAQGGYAQNKTSDAFVDAIENASSQFENTFDAVSKLCLVIGGLIGLVGALVIYSKMSNNDQDVTKRIIMWGGAALFLVASGTIIRVLFL